MSNHALLFFLLAIASGLCGLSHEVNGATDLARTLFGLLMLLTVVSLERPANARSLDAIARRDDVAVASLARASVVGRRPGAP